MELKLLSGDRRRQQQQSHKETLQEPRHEGLKMQCDSCQGAGLALRCGSNSVRGDRKAAFILFAHAGMLAPCAVQPVGLLLALAA